jgi:hypothetical protein
MFDLLDPTALSVAIAATTLVGVFAAATVLALTWRMGILNQPAAVRWSELDTLIGAREARLGDLDAQIEERKEALAARDVAEGDAEYWRSMVEGLKAEYDTLDGTRREIEEVREAHRQAVEDLGVKETELRTVTADLEAARRDLLTVGERRDEAEARLKEVEDQEETLKTRQQDLREGVTSLEEQVAGLEEQKSAAATEIERRSQQLSALRAEEQRLERENRALAEDRARLTEAVDAARTEIEAMAEDRQAAEGLRQERDALRAERERLTERVGDLTAQQRRGEARLAQIEAEIEAAEKSRPTGPDSPGGGGPRPPADPATVLEDLRTPPACLAADGDDAWTEPTPAEDELEVLHRFRTSLEDSGLVFPMRTIKAFHTSLKTAGISPLTVLAGISGTGKSQLPRRYADAMGMHFLKIPVQPRWDSPQDLFGFYNYIEERYKATELARALIHLDHHNWATEAEPHQDRMLLVLLDEMNLARVEYYFSEFLSRLEGRPPEDKAGDLGERRPAEIDIDIPRSGDRHNRVYVGQNVLFVGTMNEDESTLALSDKVLDRADVMRFPRPGQLRETIPDIRAGFRAKGYLPKARWIDSWTKDAGRLDRTVRDRSIGLINEINASMEQLGRPFGHRLGQAMLHYVANYPAQVQQSSDLERVENGLADQIEQRILPKLRGVDVEERQHAAAIEALAQLASDKLHDKALGRAIDEALLASRTMGFFTWRGFTRSDE